MSKQLQSLLETIKNKIERSDGIYSVFKRQPTFLDWITSEHLDVQFETESIEILKVFFNTTENKYGAYECSCNTYLESGGIYYSITTHSWLSGEYRLRSIEYKIFDSKESCLVEIKVEEGSSFSLYNTNLNEHSPSQVIRDLEKYSSEQFLQEFIPIMQYFSEETNKGLFHFLNEHLPDD